MRTLPPQFEIHEFLNSYDFDIGKCINYFIEVLGFDGAVVFKDPPWFSLAPHYHQSDDYLYILSWELLLEIDNKTSRYIQGDFCMIPKGTIHSVEPWNGGKYIVATEDGNFDSLYI